MAVKPSTVQVKHESIGINIDQKTKSESTSGSQGVILGDPSRAGRQIFIDGIHLSNIQRAENTASSAEKLALNLLVALFSHEELASGNCTPPIRSDIILLDQTKIKAIRAHIQYKYPVCDEEESQRWNKILKKNLNAKCRGCRPKQEPAT